MTLRPLNEVAFAEVRREFERCWPWIEEAIALYSYTNSKGEVWPTHRKEDIWKRIVEGRAFFWPGETCVNITEITTHPSGLRSGHNWLTGGISNGALDEIKHTMPAIEEWATQKGSHRMTGSGRKGWLRVFNGYHELGVKKSKNLVDVSR